MKTISKFTYTIAVLVSAVFFIFLSVWGGGLGVAHAATSTIEYTEVLDDLSKDESFNAANYPVVENDYSLQVIQIAESINDELFVYVYQPSGQVKDLRATNISLSTAINENFFPRSYSLLFLNSTNVFYKYKVDNIVLKKSVQRYYEIPEIFREFDSSLGDKTGNDNEGFEKSYPVNQLWTVTTLSDGSVDYVVETQNWVEITDKWNSFLLYYDGYYLTHTAKTVCNFLAFDYELHIDNYDLSIDKLLEADIEYTTRSFSQVTKNGTELEPTYGEISDIQRITLYDDDYGTNVNRTWLFGVKSSWKRIQSIEEFLRSDGSKLTSTARDYLKGKKWVLRFYDTTYNSTSSMDSADNYWSNVSFNRVHDVSVFRLKFQAGGKTFNLGVVDNKTGVSKEPAGEENPKLPFNSLSNWNWKVIIGAMLLVFVFVLCSPILGFIIDRIVSIFK